MRGRYKLLKNDSSQNTTCVHGRTWLRLEGAVHLHRLVSSWCLDHLYKSYMESQHYAMRTQDTRNLTQKQRWPFWFAVCENLSVERSENKQIESCANPCHAHVAGDRADATPKLQIDDGCPQCLTLAAMCCDRVRRPQWYLITSHPKLRRLPVLIQSPRSWPRFNGI